MSDKTDLTAAIALVRECQPGIGFFDGYNFAEQPNEYHEAVASVLNAVVSGDLVPAGRPAYVAGGNGAAVRGW